VKRRIGLLRREADVPSRRALISIVSTEIREGILRAAASTVDVARIVADPEEGAQAVEAGQSEFDVAIVDIATLRAILRRMRRVGRGDQAETSSPLILVLRRGDLQDALALLHLCQGIVFWDTETDKVARMIVVALDGYSAAPPTLLPDLVTDRVRVSLIERLTPTERQALALLGDALSNRAIAERIGITEPVAKSLVRTVLTKLRLKNRTEAAVLVARWRALVENEPARDLQVTTEPASS
jgi:DNA-binding NarL/FixJ family response regulator